MLKTLFQAIVQAGLPVAVTSYLLVWWALRHDYLDSVSNMKEVEKGFRHYSKNKADPEKADERRLNPVHNKWLKFGGGFYGVVALLTYAVVELGEIRDFVARYDGIAGLISQLSIGLLIEFFLESVMNFVIAISWPAYWIGDIAGEYIWVWLFVAYGGYWAGIRLALQQLNRK